MTAHEEPTSPDSARAELHLPALIDYVTVARTMAASLGARLAFTIDDIEDLRIAVDEACALLLPQARREAPMVLKFSLDAESVEVQVSVTSDTPATPDVHGFAWTVLSALASTVDADISGDQVSLTLTRRSEKWA